MARYTTCEHRGSLKDALITEKPIDVEPVYELIRCGIYKFYCYDKRINANRYLLCKMDKRTGFPAWIHEYL